jgi:predicted nuclease of predicted toxin-antitoxin system
MALRFLLDEDQDPSVAAGLRQIGIDAVSVYDLGRAGQALADEFWLEEAATQGRVLVTYNRADFQALDQQWRSVGRSHAGILWCTERSIPRRAIGELIRAVAAVDSIYESLDNLCLPLPRPPAA